MRHFIAIAEVMGLPKALQAVELNRINGTEHEETQSQRAQLWESICSADRLFGMFINLPSGTRQYELSIPSEVTINGVVQTRAYINRLTDITTRVQDMDDMNTTQRSKNEMYAAALKIDGELKELVSQTPASWWAPEQDPFKADHILRFLHSCIMMRTHLPFTMQPDPAGEYIYSRIACMDACESVANRYQFVRQRFPSGIFLSRIMDLQAFTAIVVLILTSHNSSSMNHLNWRTAGSQIESLVAQVTNLMEEQSNNDDGSKFAGDGVTAIRSLQTLLQQDKNGNHLQELSIKVPLLGNVRVRRNADISQSLKEGNLTSFPNTGSWRSQDQISHPPNRHPTLSANMSTEVNPQPEGEWQWDPLSWSIDNYNENVFQDTFMAESHDQFDVWQNI
jgi:hypothetical protein